MSQTHPAGFVGNDARGHFVHYCHCGKWGAFGYDVSISLKKGGVGSRLGKWFCGNHRPERLQHLATQWETFLAEPLYETPEQIAAEAEIITYVAEKIGCTNYKKLPIKLGLDYALMRDERITGMIEVKDRPDWTYEQLNTAGGYLISADKIVKGLNFCKLTGIKLSVAVRLAKGTQVWLAPIRETDVPSYGFTMFNGNTVPRREADKEPVFLIPMRAFKQL